MEAIKDFKELNELIPILIFLLPGFLTAKVLDLLMVRKEKDVFDKFVQALVFTFANLMLFTVLRWVLEKSGFTFSKVAFSSGNLLLMVFSALTIGMVCSAEVRNEWLLGVLRKFYITKKTYKPSTWVDTFDHVQRFVVVHLDDGRRIYGWPRFYSDEPGERAIFLENASWLSDDNSILNTIPISILIDEKSKIQLIEFIPETTSVSEPEAAQTSVDLT